MTIRHLVAIGNDGRSRPWTSDETLVMNVDSRPLRIRVESGGHTRLVKIAGELDQANRELVTRRCTQGRAPEVVVDLSELTFMDGHGHQALTDARRTLEQQRRTLTLVGAVGEPLRLLDLLDRLGRSVTAQSEATPPLQTLR